MAIPNIVPRNNDDGETLGTAAKHWSKVYTEDVILDDVSLVAALANISSNSVSVSIYNAKMTELDGSVATLRSGKLDSSVYNAKMTELDGSVEELSGGKVSVSDVANNLTTEAEGKVLDARQGKALNDSKADKTKLSMPSGTSITVALTTSYTAPADGYMFFHAYAAVAGQWVSLGNDAIAIASTASLAGWLSCFLPCKKDATVTISYSTTGNMLLSFAYAQSEV